MEVGWLLEKEFGFDVTRAITRYRRDKGRKKKAGEINALVGVQYTDKEGISNLIDALEGEVGYPRADCTRDGLVMVSELHLCLSDPLKKTGIRTRVRHGMDAKRH